MNLIKYLGGFEAVELNLELKIKEAWSQEGVGTVTSIPELAIYSARVPSPTPIVPQTDLRVPNYYRDLERSRGYTLEISGGINLLRGEGVAFFYYKQAANLLTLCGQHDKTLLKITSHVISQFAAEIHQPKPQIETVQYGPTAIYMFPERPKRYSNTLGPDTTAVDRVRYLIKATLGPDAIRTPLPAQDRQLRDWLHHTIAYNDYATKTPWTGNEGYRKYYIAAKRLLNPLMVNKSNKHPVLPLESAPPMDRWWDRVLYFSNHGDLPLRRAISLANGVARVEDTSVRGALDSLGSIADPNPNMAQDVIRRFDNQDSVNNIAYTNARRDTVGYVSRAYIRNGIPIGEQTLADANLSQTESGFDAAVL